MSLLEITSYFEEKKVGEKKARLSYIYSNLKKENHQEYQPLKIMKRVASLLVWSITFKMRMTNYY
jgi:hypothetical protein